MTPRQRKILSLLALAFPLLVLAGLAGKAALDQNSGEHIWRIPISGYDPRDLLYGHYLVFVYDWNIQNPQAIPDITAGQPHCLCLNTGETGHINPPVQPVSCSMIEDGQCMSVIRAWPHQRGRFYSFNRERQTERYFIPEKNASVIERMLQRSQHDFQMELIPNRRGGAAIRGLYVDDERLEDYLRRLEWEEQP